MVLIRHAESLCVQIVQINRTVLRCDFHFLSHPVDLYSETVNLFFVVVC